MSKAGSPSRARRAPLALAVAAALLAAPAAQAIEFENGELTGSIDTTVSYGASWRMQDRADDLLAKATIDPLIVNQGWQNRSFLLALLNISAGTPEQIAAPGRFSGNRDDGNLKYDDGDLISNAAKITSEISLNWRDWGAFARATYFYDFENADRDDLSEAAKDLIGERFRMLDAFVFRNFSYGADGGLSGNVRLGRQVVSWGESTFIQNGINVVNPVDLSALRVAGAELKEAFLPVDSLWGSFQLSDNLSLEALYLFEFEEIEIDAAGTYFSANDFAAPGGNYVMLNFGTVTQPVSNPDLYYQVCNGTPAGWQSSDLFPQFAAAYGPDVATGLIAAGCSASFQRSPNRNADDSGQYGFALRYYAEQLNETEFGFYYLNYHSRVPVLSGIAVTGRPGAPPNVGKPAPGGSFFVEYPEDIHLFGMSWNTTIPGGWAWQGELSYRPNMPLQVDDVELLFAGLTPLNALIPDAFSAAKFASQLGEFAPSQEIKGWRRHKVTQLQSTFTKVFAEALGADQIALVGEIGGTFANLPSKSELRYEGEGTDTGGGCSIQDLLTGDPANPVDVTGPRGCARNPVTTSWDGFPTRFSWGYRLAARADYNSVWGSPFNLSPRVAFNHDVNGITPGPGGNFLEGRKSATVGLEANYLNEWVFDLSYTSFFGAKEFNQIHDRDFASFSVRYSF